MIKLVVAAAAMFPFAVSAQTSSINAFSPYTMYGIGEQNTPGTLQMRSMGGAGVAMRSVSTVNLLNPAAYSAAPQKTFLFNFGLEGQNYYNSQKVGRASKNDGLQYVQLSRHRFPDAGGEAAGTRFQPHALQFGGLPDQVLPRVRSRTTPFTPTSAIFSTTTRARAT
ncbi:MAG: hypothetical protein ACLU9X_14320 [Alistipes shahii]